MTTTHYEVLGVASGSSIEEIRVAYLHKARENHPDRLGSSDPARLQESQRTMVALNAAWFVLRDANRRKLYDQELERAAERRPWEYEDPADAWIPTTEHPFDFSKESTVLPPEYGSHGHPAASIARLYLVVVVAVAILLAIAFAYAVVRSGTVGVQLPQ